MNENLVAAVEERLRHAKVVILKPLVKELLQILRNQGFTADDLISAIDEITDEEKSE